MSQQNRTRSSVDANPAFPPTMRSATWVDRVDPANVSTVAHVPAYAKAYRAGRVVLSKA